MVGEYAIYDFVTLQQEVSRPIPYILAFVTDNILIRTPVIWVPFLAYECLLTWDFKQRYRRGKFREPTFYMGLILLGSHFFYNLIRDANNSTKTG